MRIVTFYYGILEIYHFQTLHYLLLYPVGRPGVFWWTWTGNRIWIVLYEFELQMLSKLVRTWTVNDEIELQIKMTNLKCKITNLNCKRIWTANLFWIDTNLICKYSNLNYKNFLVDFSGWLFWSNFLNRIFSFIIKKFV